MEEQEENFSNILGNCFSIYKNGIKKVNQTLSLTLLFMITFTLIGLVSSMYTRRHYFGRILDETISV